MKRYVNDKWAKTQVLLRDKQIRTFVPHTRKMNKKTLKQMLRKYSMVYIKPNRGSFGKGVMRVERKASGKRDIFRYQRDMQIKTFAKFKALYGSLNQATKGKNYLVQRGIRLLKYRSRRFDIRVMVQQNPKRRWEATGVIGRVAHPGKVVTNYHNGGTPMDVRLLLRSYLRADKRKKFVDRLGRVGLRVARLIKKRYPAVCEVGVDVALDKRMVPWILEVNTRPDPLIFKKLKNKRIFYKVLRYARANGRHYKL